MTDVGELIAERYRLTSRLGTGAMGVVWQARDERLHRAVAVKQLLLSSGLSDIEADEANRRAMREARITARLHHPHAIAVYDVVEHEGQPCLIMEYLPSTSLATALSTQGVLRPGQVAKIGGQIASALAAAHKAGIVHRDIKPGNVLLTDDETAKITDFGVSHAIGDVTVTATGILVGTPAYLAPEVAQGHSAGFPSDVFSLGSTLYTALEGTPPFGLTNNAIALLHHVASSEITPPSQSGPLTPVLLRLLQRNPEQRPTMQQAQDSLTTLAAALAEPEGGPSTPALPLSRQDPPFTPVSGRRQTLIQPTPPNETTIPAKLTGMDAPASRPPAERDGYGRPRRQKLLAGTIAVVLLAAGVLVAVLINQSQVTGGNTASPTSIPNGPAQSLPALPTQPGQDNRTQVITPTAPASSPDTPEQLQRAIIDYYALIPGNLPAAWNRLTASYQQNHAGGFTGYQNFWNPVQRVTVFDVSARQDGGVDATIDYFFEDGRVVEEQTSYGLVAEDGLWKIDSSTVRSSQTKQSN
ncbi:MAG: protein kinase domain-containing protein [Pseudonocardiaceae bacterium]